MKDRSEMRNRTMCRWMNGPRDENAPVPAPRWWLAVSRGKLARDYLPRSTVRSPATCDRTPAFVSPLLNRTK
jgi:hypothetical protein